MYMDVYCRALVGCTWMCTIHVGMCWCYAHVHRIKQEYGAPQHVTGSHTLRELRYILVCS